MPEASPIKKNDDRFPPWLNFEQLRTAGLEHIAELSGDIWTDHNLHDPGITMLEVLCYALTDLGYRTRLDIKELLALNRSKQQEEDNFYTPQKILTCNPLTLLDFRKMLIDIKGVRNAWLLPAEQQEVDLYVNCAKDELQYDRIGPQEVSCKEDNGSTFKKTISDSRLQLNGLYEVYLELEQVLPQANTEDDCERDRSAVDDILAEVKRKLHTYRNLCEDYLEIFVLRDEQIGVCADIELAPDAEPGPTLERMYEAIQNLLSPRITYYTLQEMLNKGKGMEEIFEGRPLVTDYSHGFVDPDELERLELPRELHASDFYQAIMKAEGVRAVKKLYLFNYIDGVAQTDGEQWCLHLTEKHRPVFAPELSTFNFSKGVLRLNADKQNAIRRFKKQLSDFRKAELQEEELDATPPLGRHRSDLSDYLSIQHEFPLVYGIGERELPDSVSNIRKSQALQLKGYLTFYDQLLADYLSQLAHIRDLFSMSRDIDRPAKSRKTYFSNVLDSVPEVEKLVRFYRNGDSEEEFNQGQTVAVATQTYDSLIERDIAVQQLLRDFENLAISVETEAAAGAFYFLILNRNGQQVLRSTQKYDSEKEARRAAEALFFLGTLESSFTPVNEQEEHQYYFNFVYNPLDYLDYLGAITESDSLYYQRREQFLDHLLARFGEEFTEYVLLMFALNEQRKDPAEIIEDKAGFLSRYDDISRNRGRAFNYRNSRELWDTDNVSGLENRVAGLMGLDNWQRRHLNSFDVVLREEQFTFRYLDHRGVPLFEGVDRYPCREEAMTAYFLFLELVKNKKNFQPFDCAEDSVYGFRILHTGNPFALHPRTYGSPETRDRQMNCMCLYFSEPDGVNLTVGKRESGFFYQIKETEGNTLFESALPYGKALHAWQAATALKQRASDPAKYTKEPNAPDKGYGFTVSDEAAEYELSARYPRLFEKAAPRNDEQKRVIDYFKNLLPKPDGIMLELVPTEQGYYFFLFNEDYSEVYFKSSRAYETEAEACDAWHDFITQAKKDVDGSAYVDRDDNSKDRYSFVFVGKNEEGEDLELASHPPNYSDQEERDEKKAEVLTAIQDKHLDYRIEQSPTLFSWQLNDDAGKPLLESFHQFKTPEQSAAAWFEFLNYGSDPANFIEKNRKQEGLYYFQVIREKDLPLAVSVKYEQAAERDVAKEAAIRLIREKGELPDNIRRDSVVHHFELQDDEGIPLLLSTSMFPNRQIASERYDDFLAYACESDLYRVVERDGICQFQLELLDDCEEVVATTPDTFSSREAAHAHIDKILVQFEKDTPPFASRTAGPGYGYYVKDEEGTEILSGLVRFKERTAALDAFWQMLALAMEPENYVLLDDGNKEPYSFAIQDDCERKIAFHPKYYQEADDREEELQRVCDILAAYCPPVQKNEYPGSFHFDIFDEAGELILEGVQRFPSRREAQCAYYHFLDLAGDPEAYTPVREPEGCCFTFEIREPGEEGSTASLLATHPKCYPEEQIRPVIDDIATHLLENKDRFRIEALPGTWHFELWWEGCSGLCEPLLIGQTEFEDRAAAKRGFLDFLEAFEANPVFIELEEPFTFAFGENADNESGYQAIHPFEFEDAEHRNRVMRDARLYLSYYLGLYLVDEEEDGEGEEGETPEQPMPVVSTWNKCGSCDEDKNQEELLSGFRLYKGNQPVARHPRTYNSLKERDAVLAGLYEKAVNGALAYKEICLSGNITIRIREKYHYRLLGKQDQNIVLWQSKQGFSSEEEALDTFRDNWFRIIQLATDEENYHLPDDPGDPICLVDEEQQVAAIVPISFADEAAMRQARDFRIRHARFFPLIRQGANEYRFRLYNPEKWINDWVSHLSFATPEEALRAFHAFLDLLRYRGNYLKKDNCEASMFNIELTEVLLESERTYIDCLDRNCWAIYTENFDSEEGCEEALRMLVEKGRSEEVESVDIRKKEKDFLREEEDGTYYFVIRDEANTDLILWRSESKSEKKEVLKDFRDYWFKILQASAVEENYELPDGNGSSSRITLKVDDNFTVEVPKEIEEDNLQDAIQERINYALRYPVIRSGEEKYKFRVYDSETGRITWESGFEYRTASRAMQDFEVFRKCLKERRNYRMQVSREDCLCYIEVKAFEPTDAIQLESCGDKCLIRPDCPEAWEELKSFLIHAPFDYAYYPFIDYEDDCRFGFRIVDNAYRVARHPGRYHTPEERESARDWLFAVTRCLDKVDQLRAEYCRKAGRYYYQLAMGDGSYWMSYTGYDSKEGAEQAFAQDRLLLIDYARELDYYDLRSEESSHRLLLKTDEGRIIATSKGLYAGPEEWNPAVEARIKYARSYPFYLSEGRYGFQCYSFEDNPVTGGADRSDDALAVETGPIQVDIPGERIWESQNTYRTLPEAECVFDEFDQQLRFDKSNYQRTQADNCGPFGIEVTHPDQVLATHPQTYLRQQDRDAAIEQTKECINLEGFHLVEHILLRPRQGKSSEVSIQFQASVQECCFHRPAACYFNNNEDKKWLISTSGDKKSLLDVSMIIVGSLLDELPEETAGDDAKKEFVDQVERALGEELPTRFEELVILYLDDFIAELGLESLMVWGDRTATEKAIRDRFGVLISCTDSAHFIMYKQTYAGKEPIIERKDLFLSEIDRIVDSILSHEDFPGEEAADKEKVTFLKDGMSRQVKAEGILDETASDQFVEALLLETVYVSEDQQGTRQAIQARLNRIISCSRRDAGRFLLYQETFLNLENARFQKKNLSEGILKEIKEFVNNNPIPEAPGPAYIQSLETFLKKRLPRLSRNLVRKNIDGFIRALGLGELIQYDDLEAFFVAIQNQLKAVLICFDRGALEKPDQLAPICADCCNAVEYIDLAAEEASCEENGATNDTPAEGFLYIPGADPYSFWATVVIPYWPRRFQNPNFRQFFEDTLRREIPAHIGLRICWLDPKQLKTFETHYQAWLKALSGRLDCNRQQSQDAFLDTLFSLRTVYPPARIQAGGCVDSTEGGNNFVLLDQTQLS